jgi:hypothetical protein
MTTSQERTVIAGATRWSAIRSPVNFIVDDTTLYAIMSDGRPVLLHTPQAGVIREAAESWDDRVHIVSALVLGRPELSAALIRPDGVLAWAATPSTSPDTTCL